VELPPAGCLHHLDILYECRRRWAETLPDCRLQTLEETVCDRRRVGDIPGEQIAQRYHDFVRDQDARLIAPIFHHNRMDLITMMELLVALVGSEEQQVSASTGTAAAAQGPGRVASGGRREEEGSG